MAANFPLGATLTHYHNNMTIETKSSDRAQARRYLKLHNVEFVETLDGFEIEPENLPKAEYVLKSRYIIYVVNTGEL